PLRIMALSSCVGSCRERGGWPPAWEHTRDGDARRRLQGMPAAGPAGRAGLVRKGGLEPPRLAALEPKSRASTNSATFALRHCSDGPSGRPSTRHRSRWRPKKNARLVAGRLGFGGPSRIRTLDLLIKSQLLYQLS